MNIIIPIGGIGKRFLEDGYLLPKPLIKSLGKSILFWNIEKLNINTKTDIIHIVYRDEFKIFNFEDLLRNKFRNVNFKFTSIKNDTRGASETVLYALEEMSEEHLLDLTIVIDSDGFYEDDIINLSKKKQENLIFYKKDFEKKPIYSYIKLSEKSDDKIIEIKEKEKISDNACVGAYCFKTGLLLKETIKKVIKEDKKQKNEYYISSIYNYLIEKSIEVYAKEIDNNVCLGTPNQLKSFSSNFNSKINSLRFCFDLDNTLVSYPQVEGDYTTVKPIQRTIDFVNFLHNQGHEIIIYTARRMRTHNGNVGKVQADIAKITLDTLEKFQIKFDEIYFGKPYAHFYIDDLAIKPSDDLEKETGFYNIHPDTRSHNRIEISEKYITKFSSSIDGEKFYYQNIPNQLTELFPKLIDVSENSITIEKIEGIPFSFLNVSNTITKKLLEKLLEKIEIIHSSKTKSSKDINIYDNYFRKVESRISNFDFTNYENFDIISKEILTFLKKYEEEKSGRIGVIHGDPVFTNVLIDTNDNIKLIDMRGKLGESLTIQGDIFYDYAKIYQSLIGYDHILLNKQFNIKNAKENIKIFEDYIIYKFDIKTLENIKQITKSLLISLIPIHSNEKCKSYYNLIKSIR